MVLSREEIVRGLQGIVGPDRVVTDEQVLRTCSHDRFRKYETIFGLYRLPLPAAVVRPGEAGQVSDILRFLNRHRINCVPRTGATATEGGLETIVENSVVIDGSDMNRIIEIDPYNMLATAQCGVNLELLENECRKQGCTMGHSPQSKPMAQMGGLVATRSIGQFSTLYGGIEDMVVGLEAVFPNGRISRIKNVPRRSCGPDIRHVIIGNEGALCFITEVTVKLHRYQPQNNIFVAYALEEMKPGFEILREVMVNGFRPSVARLYDAEDGAQHGFDQFAEGKCVLMFMAEGPAGIAKATGQGIEDIVAAYPSRGRIDPRIIERWFNQLNWGPDKVAAEAEHIRTKRHIGFTTEVSGLWSRINEIYENTLRRIREEFPRADDLTMLGGHSSHSYPTGTNMYFVYDYNVVDCQPEEEIDKYHRPLYAMVVEETLKAGGSMGHHHGIGKHRTQWTKEEYGSSYHILEGLKEIYDPNGIMNIGTIFPVEG